MPPKQALTACERRIKDTRLCTGQSWRCRPQSTAQSALQEDPLQRYLHMLMSAWDIPVRDAGQNSLSKNFSMCCLTDTEAMHDLRTVGHNHTSHHVSLAAGIRPNPDQFEVSLKHLHARALLALQLTPHAKKSMPLDKVAAVTCRQTAKFSICSTTASCFMASAASALPESLASFC